MGGGTIVDIVIQKVIEQPLSPTNKKKWRTSAQIYWRKKRNNYLSFGRKLELQAAKTIATQREHANPMYRMRVCSTSTYLRSAFCLMNTPRCLSPFLLIFLVFSGGVWQRIEKGRMVCEQQEACFKNIAKHVSRRERTSLERLSPSISSRVVG